MCKAIVLSRCLAPLVLLWLSFCLLTACHLLTGEKGLVRDRSYDYQQAVDNQINDNDKAAIALANAIPLFSVPEVAADTENHGHWRPTPEKSVPRAQLVVRSAFGGSLQLRRLDDVQWIWSDQTPKRLMSYLQDFFVAENLFSVSNPSVEQPVEPSARQIQSSWLSQSQLQESKRLFGRLFLFSKTKGRLRYQIQPADSRNTYVYTELEWFPESSRNNSEGASDTFDEEAQQQQRAIANQWVEKFYIYLEKHWQVEKSVSTLTVEKSLNAALVVDGNGYPMLTVDQDFMVSWEAIGKALNRLESQASVIVEDLDRSLGVYFIRLPSSSRPALKEQLFELHVMRGEQSTQLTLAENQDQLAPIDVSRVFFDRLSVELKAKIQQVRSQSRAQ